MSSDAQASAVSEVLIERDLEDVLQTRTDVGYGITNGTMNLTVIAVKTDIYIQ